MNDVGEFSGLGSAEDQSVRRHYEAQIAEPGRLASLHEAIEALGYGEAAEHQLAAMDHFHVRGRASTTELAALAEIERGSRVLDAGSGLGGPSRFIAADFGCSVVGVDLSPAFVEIATFLAERTGVALDLRYQVADIAHLPFEDNAFDLVWTEHALMNLSDRTAAYAEQHRVLDAGGKLAFYEPVAVEGAEAPYYPTPWADTDDASHLLTKVQTVAALNAAGFELTEWRDVSTEAKSAFANLPPLDPQAVGLPMVMGPRFREMASNFARNIIEGRLTLAMGVARKVA